MRAKGELIVEGAPQDLRGPTKCQVRPFPTDMQVGAGLVGVGSKKDAGGLWDGDGNTLVAGPRCNV